MPSTAEATDALTLTLTSGTGGIWGGRPLDTYTLEVGSGLVLSATQEHFKPFFTFSTPGEWGNSVYQEVNICLPTLPGAATPCFVCSQNRASASFGSNSVGYGAGGYAKMFGDKNVGGMFSEHSGRDGGVIIEIL